eukprot:gnl/TRDRNA2_/TRDRNA2_91383_c0_seq1.p1 gnl/TRDRNA2_/TRDRNA2_91383_c0~~gnl/TRDRNA2_/TRDRNA2_91383_c0_seq1.p1  ORF type:complete len:501 (+),score=88.40 gnl/TRDRNA2_/TRDRNA2_91383_c0_seq1:40-1503(+)
MGHEPQWPKYLALCCVVFHNSTVVFTMRYTQVRRVEGEAKYLTTTTVFVTEVLKLIAGFVLVAVEQEGPIAAFAAFFSTLRAAPLDGLRLLVPGLLYALQNNLLFIALSNLNGAVYSVSYQLKTLMTAVFSVCFLGRKLSRTQWLSVIALTAGVALLQLKKTGDGSGADGDSGGKTAAAAAATAAAATAVSTVTNSTQLSGGDAATAILALKRKVQEAEAAVAAATSAGRGAVSAEGPRLGSNIPTGSQQMLGLAAVLGACVTSGFCGVYMEKLLKQGGVSLWMKNVQMALFSMPMALAGAYWVDGEKIRHGGFLQGYNTLVWTVVLLNALGGLAIAAVLRYADNIVKCFASAVAVLVSCFLSNLLGEFEPTVEFTCGTCLVLAATLTYGLGLPLDLGRRICTKLGAADPARARTLAVVSVLLTTLFALSVLGLLDMSASWKMLAALPAVQPGQSFLDVSHDTPATPLPTPVGGLSLGASEASKPLG